MTIQQACGVGILVVCAAALVLCFMFDEERP